MTEPKYSGRKRIGRISYLDSESYARNVLLHYMPVFRGRRLSCQLLVGKMGYPRVEVARFLGVMTPAVIRVAYSEQLLELQKYL